MTSLQKPIRAIINVAVTALMATHAAHAGSFSLYTEGTASAVGNYGAGIAAEAADASTGWYNPAGLALIHNQQVVAGLVGVFPKSKLYGNSTFTTTSLPAFVQTYSGIDGAKDAIVPSLHYARPLGENATFGFSVVSPFGLSTDWNENGRVRYEATLSQLLTSNFSPEIGGRISEHFAIGAGLDLQYATVKFNRMLGSPTLSQALRLPPTFLDSASYNTGSSFGVGFHAGAMLMLNDNHSRLGVNYQSEMDHKFHGYSRLSGRLADPMMQDINATFWSDNLSSNDIKLPDITTLSGYHDVNDSLALLASVVYTGWHSLPTIELDNVAAYSAGVGTIKANSISRLNYSNVWRVAVGANYKLNSDLMLRVGTGYDQTPTNDTFRDVRIADSDRVAASVGAHYQMRPNIGFDLGYTHLFSTTDAKINKTDVLSRDSSYNVKARTKGYADLVGIQAVWNIDGVDASKSVG